MCYSIQPIGEVFAGEEGFGVRVAPAYRSALHALSGFSHIQVLWWCTQCDTPPKRAVLTQEKPYQKAPAVLGTFATRAPERPNPIALTTAQVLFVDEQEGVVALSWIDAFDATPVLDIKPYTPCFDRVEAPQTPAWCSHWPQNVETSGDFDWESEFCF